MIGGHIDTGDVVTWDWSKGTAVGKVVKWSALEISTVINGEPVTVSGTQENPVYLIEKEDGERELRQLSELNKK